MPECDRCGEEYDSYHIFVKTPITYGVIVSIRNKNGDNLCPPCFNELMPVCSYALCRPTESQPIGRKKEGSSE